MAQQFSQTVQIKQSKLHEIHMPHSGSTLQTDDRPSSFTHPPNITKNMADKRTEWNTPPFSLPVTESNQQKAGEINDLLKFSLGQQIDDDVSDSAGFVVVLMHRCLDAICVDNQINYGRRHINGESSPHMWLNIDGNVIDNTYSMELYGLSAEYLCKNTPECYEICEFSYPESQNIQHENDTDENTAAVTEIIGSRFNFCSKEPDRTLALGLNKEQLFNYYFAMIRYIYDTHGVSIIGIDPKIRFMCWHCERYPESGRKFLTDVVGLSNVNKTNTLSKITWKFQQCGQCMVANYCSLRCQREDWINNHNITCLSRGSVYLPHHR